MPMSGFADGRLTEEGFWFDKLSAKIPFVDQTEKKVEARQRGG